MHSSIVIPSCQPDHKSPPRPAAAVPVVVVTPPSLPRPAVHSRMTLPPSVTYIITTLERPSVQSPWGMSLKLKPNGNFEVGDSIRSIVRGFWIVRTNSVPCGGEQQTITRNSLPHLIQRLFRETPFLSSSSSTKMYHAKDTTIIQPGDCILAVGGRPMREFQTMAEFQTFVAHVPTTRLQWVLLRRPQPLTPPKRHSSWVPPPPPTNPLFRDDKGKPIPYEDGGWTSFETMVFDPDEGSRASLFIRPIHPTWLSERKRTWRTLYEPYAIGEDHWEDDDSTTTTVEREFWKLQGFENVTSWVKTRTQQWAAGYSWNKDKRRRLALDCEQSVQISENFPEWLRVRKNQWRVQRRKRQQRVSLQPPPKEIQMIDDLIAEEERRKLAHAERKPLDISFIFDSTLGCPDDIVCKVFQHLLPVERLVLLQLNHATRSQLMQRENLWRLMCPTHWKLPRRPRKPWYMMYQHNLRVEMEASRKKWDDLLSKASQFLLSGDLLGAVEKLVTDAEKKFQFDINYASGVVCERNALLNLAVIHQRHRVVRWLVETKAADIETCDRGNFTPLLNAAWAGNRYLVRYLMQRGADRTTVGRFHYTKPVAPPDFAGHTAEGWAKERGHGEIARLLALGL